MIRKSGHAGTSLRSQTMVAWAGLATDEPSAASTKVLGRRRDLFRMTFKCTNYDRTSQKSYSDSAETNFRPASLVHPRFRWPPPRDQRRWTSVSRGLRRRAPGLTGQI